MQEISCIAVGSSRKGMNKQARHVEGANNIN
jgi:hypothetical protein